MLNKLLSAIRRDRMVAPGETVICAVSGGADSMALLFAMLLLKEKLEIRVEAAHFNHHLRGEESDGDEAFVRRICQAWQVPLTVGGEQVVPGKKGLEAAAREARYSFFRTLSGKIATAHTADDNAETVLLHLVRGTGLKGLGAIAPVSGRVIRPMLDVTRQEVLAFLAAYHINYREDSSNAGDDFLRNRLRHRVMPLLKAENPRLAENWSAMAQRLRLDEAALEEAPTDDVAALRAMRPARRYRALEGLLRSWGVREPEAVHLELAERLVFSDHPSARGNFPGNVTVGRVYGKLQPIAATNPPETVAISCPGVLELDHLFLRVTCTAADRIENGPNVFTVHPRGALYLRGRQPGDALRLSGGTKSLKKIMIDRKIPASDRDALPVFCDDGGILAVYGIGADRRRMAERLPAVRISVEVLPAPGTNNREPREDP